MNSLAEKMIELTPELVEQLIRKAWLEWYLSLGAIGICILLILVSIFILSKLNKDNEDLVIPTGILGLILGAAGFISFTTNAIIEYIALQYPYVYAVQNLIGG